MKSGSLNDPGDESGSAEFQLGPWRVQPRSGFIIRDQQTIRLEPKAMGVLLALTDAAGQVVSRQSIFDRVWPNQVVSDDVLTNAISTLRRHLGDDRRHHRFIETVPKRGYRLVVQPQPLAPKEAPPVSVQPSRVGRRSGVGVALGIAVIVLALLGWQRWGHRESVEPTADDGSIAVLPFDVFSDDPQFTYFADGLAEELIHQLSSDPALKVTSRTSSFQFRDDDSGMREIGRKLGVSHLLEGSVRGDAQTLRVTVQLIDARRDVHRWSRVFDVELDDLLTVQEEVSNEVAQLISGSREATMIPTRVRHPVPNEAYQLYLLGQSHMRVATVDAYAKAADYFSDAVKIAPDYPIALTQYAAVRMLLYQYRNDDLQEATQAASEALDRAIAIDPDLPEAQAVYGLLYTYNEDFPAAESAFKNALDMRPKMAFALHNYAFMLWSQSKWEQVIEPIEKALAIDPISGAAHFLLADSLAALGRFERSQAAYSMCLAVLPENRSCLLGRASVERVLGDLSTAVRLTDAAARVVPDDYIYLLTTRLGLAAYDLDWPKVEELERRVAATFPQNNFLWRARLLRAQKQGQVGTVLAELVAARQQSDLGAISWPELHARYWQGDCEGVLEAYKQELERGDHLLVSYWVLEFGHSHLTNLIFCQQQSGQQFASGVIEHHRRRYLDNTDLIDYPAGWYLLAKLYWLDGEIDLAESTLARLEAADWPFLWLVQVDPVFTTAGRR